MRAGSTTPLGDVVDVPVYSSVSSQSPSESGFGATTIVSPMVPLADDTEATPRRDATRHLPAGPRVRRRNGMNPPASGRTLSTSSSGGRKKRRGQGASNSVVLSLNEYPLESRSTVTE